MKHAPALPALGVSVHVATAAALLCTTSSVFAQQPAPAPQPIELPAVVVTSPSPVKKAKKPKRPATKQPSATPAAVPSAPAPAAAPPQEPLISAPGTLVDTQDTFVPVTVATEREIMAQGGANIADSIDHKPGISSTTFAPGASRPIIRGLDSYRVRLQENGIGSHDVSAISEDHAVPIDPFAADHVEVVRGPATLRYGSQAIGGVVSVENQRIPTYMPRNGFSGEIKGGLSSVDDGRDGAFKATAGANGIVVHADGFKRDADDYDTPNGRQANSFVESEGLSAGASHIWNDGFFGVSVGRISSFYGIPGEEAEEGVNPRIDMTQDRVQAKGEWRLHDGAFDAVRFWFGASDYEHEELAIHDPEHESEFEVGSRFTNKEQEARVEIQHVPVGTTLGEMTGAVGVHWGNRKTRGESFEGESLLEPAHTKSIAAFWFEELELSDQLRLQASTRIERTLVDGRGWSEFHEHGPDEFGAHEFAGERSFTPVSGGLGLLYDLPFATTARLSGQYVERAPDAAELFSKGMHEATGTFEVGNPFLEVEKAATIEAGLKKATGQFRFDASVYHTHYFGFIYRRDAGFECDPAPHGDHFDCAPHGEDHGHGGGGHEHAFDLMFFDQRDATFTGAEIAAQYDVARLWNGVWGIDGQYDFVRARFTNGENVPRIPPHRLGGGVYYRDDNWFARAGVLQAFDQNQIGEGEIATPGYTLVSAELSYTDELDSGSGLGKTFTVGIKGENLADDEVLNHASFKRREDVLLPGASVRVFGSLKLN